MTQSADDEKPLDPAQEAIVRKLKRMSLVSSLVMIGGFLVVFGVIAYRMSTGGGGSTPKWIDATLPLPAGARVISTTASEGRLVVTIEVGGITEVRFFDLQTMESRGRVTFDARK
jgi:hypothetical protein